MHDPAAEGDCMECHDPHASAQNYLIKMDEPALCYECHDEEDVMDEKAHRGMGEVNCTACHNPHAGDDHLLKANWKTASSEAEQ